MSTTRLALEQLLSQALGDDLEFDTTSNIGAGTTITSTVLSSYDGGQSNYFTDQWIYITESGTTNAGTNRQVVTSTTAGVCTIRGAALGAETAAVTCRMHRYNPDLKVNALKRAVEQLYPTLHKPLDSEVIITNNILPNGHFEDWASTAIPDFYGVTTAAASAITTAGLFRGATKSVRLIPSAANGYLSINSDTYPPLLALASRTANLYAWAYPEVTNDAFVEIYTKDIAGSTQTLTSTTICSSATWTQLKLEEQLLNDDLTYMSVRFKVASSTKYVYFDDALLNGLTLTQYVLPADFQDGHVSQVRIQDVGYKDQPCYDMASQNWSLPEQFRVVYNSEYSPPTTYHTLNFNGSFISNYRMRLIGYKQLESLSSDSSTIFLDGERLNLIVAKAAGLFWKSMQSPVSSQDKGRYKDEITMWDNEVNRLTLKFMMPTPSETIWTES